MPVSNMFVRYLTVSLLAAVVLSQNAPAANAPAATPAAGGTANPAVRTDGDAGAQTR